MLYELAPGRGVRFQSTHAALGLTSADVEDALAGRMSLERSFFIAAVAKGAMDRLLTVQPQGSA